jgi:hypothetical protein
VVIFVIVGLCNVEVNEFGPVQLQLVAPVAPPVKVNVLPAQIGFGEAEAVTAVGGAVLVITTSSVEAVQGALEIVHLKVLAPMPRAVSPEVGDEGVVIVPAPEINVHNPVPDAGVFPAKVAVVAQTF